MSLSTLMLVKSHQVEMMAQRGYRVPASEQKWIGLYDRMDEWQECQKRMEDALSSSVQTLEALFSFSYTKVVYEPPSLVHEKGPDVFRFRSVGKTAFDSMFPHLREYRICMADYVSCLGNEDDAEIADLSDMGERDTVLACIPSAEWLDSRRWDDHHHRYRNSVTETETHVIFILGSDFSSSPLPPCENKNGAENYGIAGRILEICMQESQQTNDSPVSETETRKRKSIMLITDHGPPFLRALESVGHLFHIEIISPSSLATNVTKHRLVGGVALLSPVERACFFPPLSRMFDVEICADTENEYGIGADHCSMRIGKHIIRYRPVLSGHLLQYVEALPHISAKDPVARFLGGRAGDVIRCDDGFEIEYRFVRPRHGESVLPASSGNTKHTAVKAKPIHNNNQKNDSQLVYVDNETDDIENPCGTENDIDGASDDEEDSRSETSETTESSAEEMEEDCADEGCEDDTMYYDSEGEY